MQDFGINDIFDLANLFDHVYNTVVWPIESAVAAFEAIISLFKQGLENVVNEIVSLTKNLPITLKSVLERVKAVVADVLKYKAYPWIHHIQRIMFKVQYFIEDLESDLIQFYNVSKCCYILEQLCKKQKSRYSVTKVSLTPIPQSRTLTHLAFPRNHALSRIYRFPAVTHFDAKCVPRYFSEFNNA